eukprot:4573319-Ditylum_brightwellii.AAC.1
MPQNKFGKNSLPVVEDDVGKVIRERDLLDMNEGLQKEIRATLDEERNEWMKKKNNGIDVGEEPLTFEMWDTLPVNDSRKCVKIIVSFDMRWQQRGFLSLSGHAFMIGVHTKKL